MDLLPPPQKFNDLWARTRDKWLSVDDFCLYSYGGRPDAKKLAAWKKSWSQEEKICLIERYALLRTSDIRGPEILKERKKELLGLFHKYFPQVTGHTKDLKEILPSHETFFTSIIEAIADIQDKETLDLEAFYQSYGLSISLNISSNIDTLNHSSSSHDNDSIQSTDVFVSAEEEKTRTPVSMAFFIDKLFGFIGSHLIELRTKQIVTFLLKSDHSALDHYLLQGLWSHQALFHSYDVVERYAGLSNLKNNKKALRKKERSTELMRYKRPSAHEKKSVKEKQIPSWMLLGYMEALYPDQIKSCLNETEIQRMALTPDVRKSLTKYVKDHQKTVIQHFKRLIYSQYAELIDQATLGGVGFSRDENRGLTTMDMGLIQNFYDKWQEFTQFNDSELNESQKIRQKIHVYLQYHGFHIEVDKSKGISVFSWGTKNVPPLGFSLDASIEFDGNDFIKTLGSGLHCGYKFLKKHGPTIGTILITAAALLDNVDDEQPIPLDQQGNERSLSLSEGLSTAVHELCDLNGPQVQNLDTQTKAGKKKATTKKHYPQPSMAKAEQTDDIEHVIAQHFADYAYSLIEDHLNDPGVEGMLPLDEKFPWIKNLSVVLHNAWKEYYYHFDAGTAASGKIGENLSDVDRLGMFAEAMKTQPSWILRLMQFFDVGFNELEQARENLCKGHFVRLKSQRLEPHNWDNWLNEAHNCWMTSALLYLNEWEKSMSHRLHLPHIGPGHPAWDDSLSERCHLFLQRSGQYKARDTFSRLYSRPLALEVSEKMSIDFERDPLWLDYALAFDAPNIVEKFIKHKVKSQGPLSDFWDQENRHKSAQDIIYKSIIYNVSLQGNQDIQNFFSQRVKDEQQFNTFMILAHNTTASRFEEMLESLKKTRMLEEKQHFFQRCSAIVFENWGHLRPTYREERKLQALIPLAEPLTFDQLKNLIHYGSPQILKNLCMSQLIKASSWGSGHDLKNLIEHLTICAYRHGNNEMAQYLLDSLPRDLGNGQYNLMRIYWATWHSLRRPKSIKEQRGIPSQNIDVADIQMLSRRELQSLLMHSAGMAVTQIVPMILGAPEFQQTPIDLMVLCQMAKQLDLSQAAAYQKLRYLKEIFEVVLQQQTPFYAWVLMCYHRRLPLDEFIMELQRAPKMQRGSESLADSLMHVIVAAAFERANQSDIAGQGRSRKVLKTKRDSFLTLDFLEKMIQKRWCQTLTALLPQHQNHLPEQWLPLYQGSSSERIKQTGYYRQFEKYMLFLIQEKVLFHNPCQSAERLYKYWKNHCYVPSQEFATQVIKEAANDSEKTYWLKIFLKLSALYDNNNARCRRLWEACLHNHNPANIKIHNKSLVEWVKKTYSFGVAKAYFAENYDMRLKKEMSYKFPTDIEAVQVASCDIGCATLPSRRWLAPLIPLKTPQLISGYNIVALRTYLMQNFQSGLDNPALAVRTMIKETLSQLMRGWVALYSNTPLSTIRRAIKDINRARQQRYVRAAELGVFSLENEESFLDENIRSLVENDLLFLSDRQSAEIYLSKCRSNGNEESACKREVPPLALDHNASMIFEVGAEEHQILGGIAQSRALSFSDRFKMPVPNNLKRKIQREN